MCHHVIRTAPVNWCYVNSRPGCSLDVTRCGTCSNDICSYEQFWLYMISVQMSSLGCTWFDLSPDVIMLRCHQICNLTRCHITFSQILHIVTSGESQKMGRSFHVSHVTRSWLHNVTKIFTWSSEDLLRWHGQLCHNFPSSEIHQMSQYHNIHQMSQYQITPFSHMSPMSSDVITDMTRCDVTRFDMSSDMGSCVISGITSGDIWRHMWHLETYVKIWCDLTWTHLVTSGDITSGHIC